jgi:hypothetical protein
MKLTTQLRDESKTAANKGFAISRVPCFADTFVQSGSLVHRTKFGAQPWPVSSQDHCQTPRKATVKN